MRSLNVKSLSKSKTNYGFSFEYLLIEFKQICDFFLNLNIRLSGSKNLFNYYSLMIILTYKRFNIPYLKMREKMASFIDVHI